MKVNTDTELIPLVVVEGFLSTNDLSLWKNLMNYQTQKRKVILVNLGPLSSVHDRCCELFYQLKGGQVDYGLEHSKKVGHKRYGKKYIGLYPKWSTKYPLHILGHSLGGLTCVRFQHMLHNNFFNMPTNENWIKSITTISAAHRGSTVVYTMGAQEGQAEYTHKFSIGSFIYRVAYLISWLCLDFELNLEHWELYKLSWYTFLWNFIWNFQFDNGKDNAATDLTTEKCEEYNNKYSQIFKNTYYRSYAASMCYKYDNNYIPIFNLKRSLITMLPSFIMGYYQYQNKKECSKWRDNDGILPLVSQYHPDDCKYQKCIHLKYNKLKDEPNKYPLFLDIIPNIWYVVELNDACHFGVLRSKKQNEYQDLFKDFWLYLDDIDFYVDKGANSFE